VKIKVFEDKIFIPGDEAYNMSHLHQNQSNGLLFQNVQDDINECAINIMFKHNLTGEAKMIKEILDDEEFIDTMSYGNFSEVRSAIITASRPVFSRLGQDTDLILQTMPDAVVEWVRVSSLMLKIDYEQISFSKEGKVRTETKQLDVSIKSSEEGQSSSGTMAS
jgi:hypothetical protein